MTVQEMIAEIPHLSQDEQRVLLAALHQSLREQSDEAWRKEFEAERARLLAGIPPESSTHRTFGMLRTSAFPPTDEEIREDYTNYLMRKHS